MTPEEQRIAIAEACGWRFWPHVDCQRHFATWNTKEKWCLDNSGMESMVHDVPDYLNDLNAMADAERTLTDDQQREYIRLLIDAQPKNLWSLSWDEAWLCASATAYQRAEAFLKTIGKWQD